MFAPGPGFLVFPRVGTIDSQTIPSTLPFDDDDLARLGPIRTKRGKTPVQLPLTCLRTLALARTVHLKRRCIGAIRKDGWDEAMIAMANARRGTGGPTIKAPASLAEGLDQVEGRCREWLKRDGAISCDGAGWLAAPGASVDGRRIREVAQAVRRVARAALDLEKRLAKLAESSEAGTSEGPSSRL